MHVDTLVVACMVAALLARGRPVVGGALLGVGVALKLNAGLVALGPAWELRRRPARLALMAGIALAVVAVGYAIVGPAALEPVTRTSKSVSNASFWKLVQGWLQSTRRHGQRLPGRDPDRLPARPRPRGLVPLPPDLPPPPPHHRAYPSPRAPTGAAAEPLPGDPERSPDDPERLPGDLERPRVILALAGRSRASAGRSWASAGRLESTRRVGGGKPRQPRRAAAVRRTPAE